MAACPVCGFLFNGNGRSCPGCRPWLDNDRPPPPFPPLTSIRWLNRPLTALLCGSVIAVVGGVGTIFYLGLMFLMDFLQTAGTSDATVGIPIWKELLLVCCGLGFLMGVWAGWAMTTEKRMGRWRTRK